jgi:predicted amidohydrolase YtcJ
MVIINAKIHTVDPQKPQAEAVAIKNGIISAVGSMDDIETLITSKTKVIDAEGKLVLPGFNDAHLHFIGGGQSLLELDLVGCKSVEDVQNRLKAVARTMPKGEWITGRGWDHTLFNKGKWPDKSILDAVTTEHSVYVHRVDGHVGWANSRAMELAGITKNTPVPDGGEMPLGDDGEPTGIFKESAMGLISGHIPENSATQTERALATALQEAARLGVTSIQDNSGIETMQLYHTLLQKNELTVRVTEWMDFNLAQNADELIQTKTKYAKLTNANLLEIGLLKGFLDGTLGSRTAYFFDPYEDNKNTVGLPQYSQTEVDEMIQTADSLGFQVGLHCIGSKANWMALTAYIKAQKTNGAKDIRHRLEHAQVLRVQDIPKLAEYNVIASMQPTHCTSDLRWAEKRIGHERAKGAYAWRRILDSGGKIAFGTDWPVEPLDPMRGLYSAVARQNIDSGEPEDGWFPDQRLTIEEAIYCYTMGSAYAEFKEDIKGSITPGKVADIIILEKDILTIDPKEILTTKVDMTIFNGNVIHTRK